MADGLLVIDVWECWVSDKADTFQKCYTRTECEVWFRRQLLSMELHDRIHIVKHHTSEYFTAEAVV